MDQKYSYLEKIDREPSNLIKGLQAVQGSEGYVSDEIFKSLCDHS